MRSLHDQSIVLATSNRGKIAEISTLLNRHPIEIALSTDLGIEAPAETQKTLEGNARLKATNAVSRAQMIALADDSGLEVEALGNQPGVATADWAEDTAGRNYALGMRRVWQELENLKAPFPRYARFRSAICVAWPDGETAIFEGQVDGHLVWPPRGQNGFGYDPIFVPLGCRQTFAEMSHHEKSKLSHRARALKSFARNCLGAKY